MIGGSHSRSKGARGEREAAVAVRAAWGLECIRAAQANGKHSADLVAPDGRTIGVYLEVKRYARIAPLGWHRRATAEAPDDAPAVVLLREDGDPHWYALGRVDDIVPRCLA